MIITLSRQVGSEGDTIAARVAAALGLTLVDREYVYRAARAAGVPDELLHRLMYEGGRSMAAEIVDSLGTPQAAGARQASNPLLDIFAPVLPMAAVNLEEASRSVGLAIKDVASRGGVLVLGQGGQMWLRGYAGACHVQVIAPLALRVERLANREGISHSMALRRVRANDQARSDYLARYHNVRWLDPLLYHLVVNTGQTSVETAVALIIHAGQACAGSIR